MPRLGSGLTARRVQIGSSVSEVTAAFVATPATVYRSPCDPRGLPLNARTRGKLSPQHLLHQPPLAIAKGATAGSAQETTI